MSLKSTNIDARQLLLALKRILKERKIPYSKVARDLDVSLPTVKRMLNKPGLPLDRLLAICRIADVDLEELVSRSGDFRPKHYIFTAEQDQLFFDRPEFLSYFSELTYSEKSPGDIAAEFSLSPRSTEAYLIGLAAVGLIERDTGTDIHILVSRPFGFGPDSKVLQRKQTEFISDVTAMVLSPERSKCFAIMKPLILPESTFRELTTELSDLVSRYAFLSEGMKHPDCEDWNLSIAAGSAEVTREEPAIVNID